MLNVSRYSKAIAHPVRITLLNELAGNGPSTCGQLVSILPLAQSTVSQHLNELVESGLISREYVATRSVYSLNWNAFQDMSEQMLLFIKGVLEKKEYS